IERKLHVFKPEDGAFINVLQDGNIAFGEELRLHVGQNGDAVDFVDRELVFNIEGTDAFDGVAKELDAVRQIVGERENIYNTPAHGELSGLINEVDPLKIVFDEKFIDKID